MRESNISVYRTDLIVFGWCQSERAQNYGKRLTCGLLRVLKPILGVEGKEKDGEPRDGQMTE